MNIFNFIDIYICIPVSGCVGRDHSALLCPGAYNAVPMAQTSDNISNKNMWSKIPQSF